MWAAESSRSPVTEKASSANFPWPGSFTLILKQKSHQTHHNQLGEGNWTENFDPNTPTHSQCVYPSMYSTSFQSYCTAQYFTLNSLFSPSTWGIRLLLYNTSQNPMVLSLLSICVEAHLTISCLFTLIFFQWTTLCNLIYSDDTFFSFLESNFCWSRERKRAV